MHIRLVVLTLFASALGCGTEQTPPPLTVVARDQAPVVTHRVARGNLRFVRGYEVGKREADKQRRPMMVYFSADWGEYCKSLERETFTDRGIVALADQFVLVLVDADEQREICRQFDVSGYPMLQFLSPAGLDLGRVEGKQPNVVVLRAMRTALRATRRSIAESNDDVLR